MPLHPDCVPVDTSHNRDEGISGHAGLDPVGRGAGHGVDRSAPGLEGDVPEGDGPKGARGRRRAVLVVLLVLLASAAVAIGVTGVTGAGLVLPPMQDEGWVRGVRIAGAAALIAGIVGLLVQRRRIGSAVHHGPDPTAAAMLSAGTIMGVVLLLALLMPRTGGQAEGGAGPAPSTESGVIDPDAPRTDPPPPPSSTAPVTEGFAEGDDREEPEWRVVQSEEAEARRPREGGLDRERLRRAGSVLLAVLLGAILVAAILALRKRAASRREEPPLEPPVDAAVAEAGLEGSLGEVSGEGDPRHRITAAYQRLLEALAAAGAAREPHEAPYEHLRRALEPLGVEPGPMHRLTELYVLAQFGNRAVGEEHRARAVEALETSLEALRLTIGLSAAEGARGADGADGAGADPDRERRRESSAVRP